jgi:hypothetical protein
VARWLVPLAGERIDLEVYPRWFPNGEIFAIEENGKFYLAGPGFETLVDAEAVLNKAQLALSQFTSIISLIWPELENPIINGVTRETDQGKRNQFLFLGGSIKTRGKVDAAFMGSYTQSPERTKAQEMLGRANQSSHLETANTLWRDQTRSWPRLYRILEEIEGHLGKTVVSAGLCSRNERERFTRSANTAEVAGADARHATGKVEAPPKPMTLDEATGFVRRIFLEVLK